MRERIFSYISLFLFMALTMSSCVHESIKDIDAELITAIESRSPNASVDYFILADETDYANLPNQDPRNPITKEKVDLGRMLFFETGIGQTALYDLCKETYSCATCHVPERAFLPGRFQGIADGAVGFGTLGDNRMVQLGYEENELDAQGTRPLTVMNVAYVTNTLWSGLFGAGGVNEGTEEAWTGLAKLNETGFTGLEVQNIENFDLHRMELNEKVLDQYGYRAKFDQAFPDIPIEERYTTQTGSFALSAYLRSLLTTQAPFQEYLKGDYSALTERQKQGAMLFFGKAGCTSCHSGPSFSSMTFHVMGTRDLWEVGGLNTSPVDPRNFGRGGFTGNEEDMFKFKVPQLYNLKDYTHFFHGASKTSLRGVIEFKAKAKSENPLVSDDLLSNQFRALTLTVDEKEALLDFLENGLYDPNMTRHVPEEVLSGNCFPNNDQISKKDMGCD